MKKSLLATLLIPALVVAFALPAWAAPEPYQIEIRQTGSISMAWLFNETIGVGELRVTGPKHFNFTRELKEGRFFEFKITEGSEDPRDGTYRWSISYTSPVSGELAQAIKEAREKDDVCFIDEIKEEGIFASGTFSGTFLLLDGRMIVPEDQQGQEEANFVPGRDDQDEPTKEQRPRGDLPTKDQVILDDLIVDGSACIGFDCVNGESFGFDTIRLKENNLRIKFQDTSTTASFPSTDWQLTANASANGGANKFSIDDISSGRTPFTVEGNAPSNSLYVDDGGRIGLGTSIPVADIHAVNGNTPTLRLEQNGSSGFAPQTFDVAGNETNFFIRDASNGSTLPFRIRPGADTSSIFIDTTSFVGINTASPDNRFHVLDSGTAGTLRIVSRFENNGPVSMQLFNSDTSESWVFSNKVSGFEISKGMTGVNEFVLDGSGNLTITGQLTTAMNTYPDYVFKEGYELMPLDDLRAFINTNGHLPNIKPEGEVGYGAKVNISELQRGLLEKVEELTLYTLDQHEADRELREADQALLEVIERQNDLIEQLEARLAALEAR